METSTLYVEPSHTIIIVTDQSKLWVPFCSLLEPFLSLNAEAFFYLSLATSSESVATSIFQVLLHESDSQYHYLSDSQKWLLKTSVLVIPNPILASVMFVMAISLSSDIVKTVGPPAPAFLTFPCKWSCSVLGGTPYFFAAARAVNPSVLRTSDTAFSMLLSL